MCIVAVISRFTLALFVLKGMPETHLKTLFNIVEAPFKKIVELLMSCVV